MKRLTECCTFAILSCIAASGFSEEPYWRTRPGGLSSVAFTFPNEPESAHQKGYFNLDFFITISKDPGTSLSRYPIPADLCGDDSILGYYWANQFAFVGGSSNGVDGYMGLQTVGNMTAFDPAHRNDPSHNRQVKLTRLAIFSIWGALDAAAGPSNSYCAPFGHEGSGWSCTLEYDWKESIEYCLRIAQLSQSANPDDAEWWRGSVINTVTNQEFIIGDLKVPAKWGWLAKDASCFTEYYSQTVNQQIGDADEGNPNPRVCQLMPKAEVLIHPPRANNRAVRVSSMTPSNYGKCASVSSFARQSDGSIIASGTRLSTPDPLVNRTGSIEISK